MAAARIKVIRKTIIKIQIISLLFSGSFLKEGYLNILWLASFSKIFKTVFARIKDFFKFRSANSAENSEPDLFLLPNHALVDKL
jgi:hypothetical protein